MPFSLRRTFVLGALVLGAMVSLFGLDPAGAQSLEQVLEGCRESVGRPIVQPCVQSGGSLESCRSRARPKVQACVKRVMDAAHGRANVPVEIPKELTSPDSADAVQSGPPAAFVAPPRTITDITAILDSEKPDITQIEKLRAEADAKPPGGTREALAWFYYQRGYARAELGQLYASIADAKKAIEIARGGLDANLLGRLQQFAGSQYLAAGNPRQALAIFSEQIRDTNVKGGRGHLFGGYRQISAILVQMGDLVQAEAFLRRNTALIVKARTSGDPGWRQGYAKRGQAWEAEVELNHGIVLAARGKFREAEAANRNVELRLRAFSKLLNGLQYPPPQAMVLQAADMAVVRQARMKARQGRLVEAEVDARRALLSQLRNRGKYHTGTVNFIRGLSDILIEQGRYQEARKLLRAALDINRVVGVVPEAQSTAELLASLGDVATMLREPDEAAAIYAELDAAIATWEPQRREAFDVNGSRIYSLYASGQFEAGIAAAQALLKRENERVGEKHNATATARGTLAIGYMRAGQDADAVREFKTAIPVLMAAARENADDDSMVVAARSDRLQTIVETYIGLLAKMPASSSVEVAVETFRFADAIRGQSVQQALSAASARMNVKDPDLADLVRKEQDLTKQVNAQLGTLTNVLSLPIGERDENGVKALNGAINEARVERDNARSQIGRRFPAYADLVEPKAPTAQDIQNVLKPDEALLSFYFGREASFVWAVPKDGPIAFAVIAGVADEIDAKVRKLRAALEPEVETLGDIPPFDVELAHELYALLLQPVAASWQRAKTLIVATNGALGLLPLGLLPTASRPANERGDEPMFAGYRDIPWLARSHAVAMVPSAASLRTLRELPSGSGKREPLIGFGDPLFSAEQVAEAGQTAAAAPIRIADAAALRGLPFRRRSAPQTTGFDNAVLSILPRLPDTADELKAMALALGTDPARALNLGKDANEKKIKSIDLARYRIIAFATHGLAPGELNGLTQPALALTAPSIADVDGDGLLTMEEILALKLDADWVVLSACNTGTGAEAGAEAASGLGRAFIYAGTRSLLLTNWSVHSASARDLVTDVFRRHAGNAALARAEGLRQAMMALVDGPGFVDPSGRTLFTYAHPLFWAPYTILGDGGGT